MIEIRTLQYEELKKNGLEHFDSWASTFGETQSAFELSPEGTGYRVKTRFSKFYNLPELMSLFKEVADIQTADMLNLPVPKAHFEVIKTMPSDEQKEILKGLSERADKVRNRAVEPDEDNMLKITNDGTINAMLNSPQTFHKISISFVSTWCNCSIIKVFFLILFTTSFLKYPQI